MSFSPIEIPGSAQKEKENPRAHFSARTLIPTPLQHRTIPPQISPRTTPLTDDLVAVRGARPLRRHYIVANLSACHLGL